MHLAAHDDVAKRALVNKPKLSTLAVGASGFLCCARDFYGEDDGEEDAIVWRADGVIEEVEPPYDGAPEGTLPTFRVQFSEACGSVVEVVKTGQIDLPASVTTDKSDRDRSRRERSRRRRPRGRGHHARATPSAPWPPTDPRRAATPPPAPERCEQRPCHCLRR